MDGTNDISIDQKDAGHVATDSDRLAADRLKRAVVARLNELALVDSIVGRVQQKLPDSKFPKQILEPAQAITEETALAAAVRIIETIPDYTDGFNGRGIVMCAGGLDQFSRAWIAINALRVFGSTLPVQMWHLGPHEISPRMEALVKPLGVQCVDASQVRLEHPARILNGWELKPYAVLHCPYKDVLLLDADNVVVRNPDYLFDLSDFEKFGAIFWPDPCRLDESREIWSILGVAYRDEPEFDGGAMLIDKKRCWKPLNLAMWYNEHSDFFYQYTYGVKETFHMAWRRLEEPYGMTSNSPLRRGNITIEHDFEGNQIFQHGVRLDFINAREPGDIILGNECWGFLKDLRSQWDGTIDVDPPANDLLETPESVPAPPGIRSIRTNEGVVTSFLEARVYTHDHGDFRSVTRSNVLIYWPHGLGDLIFLSYILPYLNQSNKYWITRFGDDSTAIFDGCELARPLYLGINSPHCDYGGLYGIKHFGLDYAGLDGSPKQIQMPQSLYDACDLNKIDAVFWSWFPETHGHIPFPFHTKGRNLLQYIAGAGKANQVVDQLAKPLKPYVNFSVAPWIRQWVEAKLKNFGCFGGRKLCLITRNGYTCVSKNWGYLWRDEYPGGPTREGEECRDFMRLLLRKDPKWMFLVMEDQLFSGDDTVRSPSFNCFSYAEVFGTVGTSSIPFATILKALMSFADLSVGVPSGPYHLGMAKGDLPTIGIWLDHLPTWYDEPNDASIHLIGKNVVDTNAQLREGSFLTKENYSYRHEWIDHKTISGERVLDTVEQLLYSGSTQRSKAKPLQNGRRVTGPVNLEKSNEAKAVLLDLSNVTLVATASTLEYVPGTIRAIRRCLDVASFAGVILFTSQTEPDEPLPGVTYIKIDPFESYESGSILGFKSQDYTHLFADHILSVNWDGFIVNPKAWTDEFLEYDWVGAPWPDNIVGNNGFGLISKRLLELFPYLDVPLDVHHCHPFDGMICRHHCNGKPGYRAWFESKGMRWPDPDFARKFSVEGEPYRGSFGFHGKDSLLEIICKGLI